MNAEESILVYETVAQITSEMLSAARNGHWDDLTGLEKRCASHVRTLARDEEPVKLSPELRNRKLALLRRILADDREIRDLADPWMRQLSELIHSSQTERKLSVAYGSMQTG